MMKTILTTWSVILAMSYASTGFAEPAGKEYLSDRTDLIVSAQQGWGQLGLNVAAHDPGTQPLPLQVKDKTYSEGLGSHAASQIIVLLDGMYTKFESLVGVQRQSGLIG